MTVQFGTRRLQKGSTSYVLPIPPIWVASMGVGKGSALTIEMLDDNSLRIIPS